MIEVYKLLTDKYDNNVNLHLERQKDSLKLVHPRRHYDLQKYSFTVVYSKNCQFMEQSTRECRFSQYCKYL